MTLMLKKKDSIMNDFSVSTYLSFFYLFLFFFFLIFVPSVYGSWHPSLCVTHGAEIWMPFGIFRMTAHLHKNTQICTQHKIQTKTRIFWFWEQFHNQVYMFQDQSSAVMVLTKVNQPIYLLVILNWKFMCVQYINNQHILVSSTITFNL